MSRSQVELLVDAGCHVAESPLWRPRERDLLWVDIPAGTVHRLNLPTSHLSSFRLPGTVSAVLSRSTGDLVVVGSDTVWVCAVDGSTRRALAQIDVPPGGRFNDAAVASSGSLWAGTAASHSPGLGRLVRVGADGAVELVLGGLTVSNGLTWAPDHRTFYLVDSPSRGVDAFDHDPATGHLSRRRVLVNLGRGRPDGLAVDAEGCLWVALWQGAAVARITPTGKVDRVVDIPVLNVTNCAFGGPGLETLFITTARNRSQSPPQRSGNEGAVFALNSSVPGVPTHEFGV